MINCRACGSGRLIARFSLGEQRLSEFPLPSEPLPAAYPLNLVECADCHLIQLDYTVPRDVIYRKYWFLSGTSPQNVEALRDIVRGAQKHVKLKENDLWVDIGSNDGTLLSLVPCERFGFEPARNLALKANEKAIPTAPDYFYNGTVIYDEMLKKHKPRVISAIAMFYDLDEPHKFVEDVKQILAPDGLFVIQQNYLVSMLVNNCYDNISNEHLCYYSLRSLEAILAAHDLVVTDVECNDVNGGSFRVYVRHKPEDQKQSVKNLRKYEEKQLTEQAWVDFARRVYDSKTKLVNFLQKAKADGKRVMGLGASNRGHVILQYCGIGPDLVQAFVERDPNKVGRTTVTKIPIVSEDAFKTVNPPYALVMPYFLFPSILSRYSNYAGIFILPLPVPKLVSKGRSQLL